jgi:hypothetical protein
MDQKFVKFEEALGKLGISADRLNQLREDGELRAYRDGASWKFRADDIDRLVSDGVPDPPPPSDIGLASAEDLVEASPLESLPELDAEFSLADDEDTVTAGGSDALLNLAADEPSDPSDSILLSEETLGEAAAAPPSTIIGRGELESKDADLDLVLEDDADDKGSDVRLAGGSGASDVHSAGVAGSGVLDDVEKEASHASAFEKLEELEIDLAAESSRVLNPDDMAEMHEALASSGKPAKKGDSDLTLKDVELAGEDEGTDPVPEELPAKKGKKKDDGPTSDLELATDEDDFVLAEAGGSDITLDSGDSGINLIDPSDSGLALDDIPLEMGGSAILESLNLDKGRESDISLIGSDIQSAAAPPPPAKGKAKGGKQAQQAAALQTDDDFRLTPLGDADDDADSSSQVIALDADLGDMDAPAAGILGDDAFAEVPEGDAALEEDYPTGDEGGFETAGYAAAAARDSEYSVMNIVGLGSCAVLLFFGGVVMLDMVRNVWSWDQNFALNDSLLESILGMFGLS